MTQRVSPPTGPLCTRESLADELRDLGINKGDNLLVHSSLSSLGWVNGASEAVVLALLDVLGDQGTLVVPTHCSDNSDPAKWQMPPVPEAWWQTIRDTMLAFNPATSRTRSMGAIPETARTWFGAIRSAHPQTSFAAIGPQATFITAGHALDSCLGEQSPLARLEEVHARVLLLGVGFNRCTSFHLAEYRLPGPMVDNSFAVMTKDGRRWMTVRDRYITDECFDELGADLEKGGLVTRGKVGGADVRIFPMAEGVAYARKWIALNRPDA